MSTIQFDLFCRNEISGRDFHPFVEGEIRNIVASPNNENAVKIHGRANNSILLDNRSDVPFELTLTGYANNENHVYALCKYNPRIRAIEVNNNWTFNEFGVDNILISGHDTTDVSSFFNIRFHSSNFNENKMSRIDIRINQGAIASLFFTPTELLFINLDGNDVQADLVEQTDRLIRMGMELNMHN